MTVRVLTREEARRIAVRAQLLDAERPPDLASMVERLTLLQLDPIAAVAPSADLVAWSRLGDAYQPAQLLRAQDPERTLFEQAGGLAILRPMADLRLYLARMAAWPFGSKQHLAWMAANDGFRRRVLDQLRESGPLLARDIPDTSELGWQSSGWRHGKNVTEMLGFLMAKGEVAISSRLGRQRTWDIAERVYPPGIEALPEVEASRLRAEKRLRALGVARPKDVEGVGIAAQIEGTTGEWRADPDATAEGFAGRNALLSPFDRLIHDRVRAKDLFDFEFTLEMYKPAAARRWGYYALPILHGDRLVGKVDATADRKAGRLVVRAIHEDVPFTPAIRDAVAGELGALGGWLGLED